LAGHRAKIDGGLVDVKTDKMHFSVLQPGVPSINSRVRPKRHWPVERIERSHPTDVIEMTMAQGQHVQGCEINTHSTCVREKPHSLGRVDEDGSFSCRYVQAKPVFGLNKRGAGGVFCDY
jgi:hypothetical protein